MNKKILFKAVILLVLMLAVIIFAASCSADKYIPNQPIKATLPPYGGSSGGGSTANCNHQIKSVLDRTTVNGESQQIDACTLCGYSSSGYKYYNTLALLREDCKGSNGAYSGQHSKIIVKLSSNYNGQKISLQGNVNEIILIGTEGQTNSNLKIEVLSRSNDITIDMHNVRISADQYVIESTKCSQAVKLNFTGNECRLATVTAAAGTAGKRTYNSFGQWYATSGEDGKDASDVIKTNGDVIISASATTVIEGGNGGMGGAGGDINISLPTSGSGGRGGNGGNGGDAVDAQGTVSIAIGSQLITLKGGRGGSGGMGGLSRNGTDRGQTGYNGLDGKTGLE